MQACNENNPTNTTKERSIDGVYPRALDAMQGGYEVLDLKTGQTTTRFKVDELPTPPEVIKRVEQLADRDGFKPHAEPIFRTYALIPGVNDEDASDVGSVGSTDSETEDTDDESDDDDEQQIVELENEGDFTAGVDTTPQLASADDQSTEAPSEQEQIEEWQPHEQPEQPEVETVEEQDPAVEDEPEAAETAEEEDPAVDDEPVPEPPRRSGRRSTMPAQFIPIMSGPRHLEVNHLITQGHPEETLECTTQEAKILAMTFAQVYICPGVQPIPRNKKVWRQGQSSSQLGNEAAA